MVAPYQGTILLYPNRPYPAYDPRSGPYWSTGCIGSGLLNCQQLTLAGIVNSNQNVSATVTGKPTGLNISSRPETSRLMRILFRTRDNTQVVDSRDLIHPFNWLFVCSTDNGLTFNPAMPKCRWNNSTGTVHEVAGNVPVEWDNLAGFDTNPTIGRITAEGFVTRFGVLNQSCIEVDVDCHPIKMVNMFVGYYGASLAPDGSKGTFAIVNLPERDIYFCGLVVCSETAPGAVPSGWINSQN